MLLEEQLIYKFLKQTHSIMGKNSSDSKRVDIGGTNYFRRLF